MNRSAVGCLAGYPGDLKYDLSKQLVKTQNIDYLLIRKANQRYILIIFYLIRFECVIGHQESSCNRRRCLRSG